MPGRNPAIIANINICQFVRLRIDKTLPPGLFFEGFEKGNDEDDDDEDEGEGGKDGAGLQAPETAASRNQPATRWPSRANWGGGGFKRTDISPESTWAG